MPQNLYIELYKDMVYIGKYMFIYTYVNTRSHTRETTHYRLFLMNINVLPNYSYRFLRVAYC